MEEEADESQYWMEVLEENHLINFERIEAIKKEVNEIVCIVVASIKTARGNENRILNRKSKSKIVNGKATRQYIFQHLVFFTEEAFYYASLIHLVFVKIHPFNDGNGRIARLLEKWFLSSKLGEKAWYINSELYYYQHLEAYYQNLARVGMFYEQLEYEKGIPFLLMLPKSLTNIDERIRIAVTSCDLRMMRDE